MMSNINGEIPQCPETLKKGSSQNEFVAPCFRDAYICIDTHMHTYVYIYIYVYVCVIYIYSYIYTYILDSVGKCTCIDSIHVHISGEKHLYRLGLSIAMFDYQRVP